MIVGRDDEMARLVDTITSGGIAVATGPAGIGKTSLLRGVVDAIGSNRVAWGGGLATLSWSPYLPLARALREPVLHGDAEAVVDGVATRLADGGVLVLDDLQWCDRATLDMLPRLAARVPVLGAIRVGDPGTAGALEACERADALVVEVAPLEVEAAIDVVRILDPTLPAHTVEDVVGRARGNPLVLRELVVTGETSPLLGVILTARVRQLGADAAEALAMLGLLGRPAPAGWLPAVEELVAAGAAHVVDRQVTPAHDLLATAAVELLEPPRRAALHATIARLAESDGEAARHHLAAGEAAAALERAVLAATAATRPGERAQHLGIAAQAATGDGASALRLQAAEALIEAGDYDQAERLALDVEPASDETRAAVALLRGEAAYFKGDMDAARAHAAAGLQLVAGSDTPVEVRLRILESRFPVRVDWDVPRALDLTASTWALADRLGFERAKARSLLGSAHLIAGDAAWTDHFEAARQIAIESGDVDTEAVVTNSLIMARFLNKEGPEGERIGAEGTKRMQDLKLRGWELQFRSGVVGITALTRGRYADALAEALWLADQPDLDRTRRNNRALAGYCAACLGKYREADRFFARAAKTPGADGTSLAVALLAEMEVAWWRHDLAAVRRAYDESAALDLRGFPTHAHAVLIRAWVAYESGDAEVPDDPQSAFSIADGVAPELAALRAMVARDYGGAEELFREAASAWEGAIETCRFRAMLGRAEAMLAAGDTDGARRHLEGIECEAASAGLELVRSRVSRLLRSAGGHGRGAARTVGRLTLREFEVVGLVAEGLSSLEIGERLSVAASTVDAQVASAMRKLGASTRLEAASMLRRLVHDGG